MDCMGVFSGMVGGGQFVFELGGFEVLLVVVVVFVEIVIDGEV